jgi:hypothetical protein
MKVIVALTQSGAIGEFLDPENRRGGIASILAVSAIASSRPVELGLTVASFDDADEVSGIVLGSGIHYHF